MLLNNILTRLSGVRKGGSGYVAKCPSHPDNKQSLSIAEGDGRILLNCFAGCTADAIVSQLGLQWKDLFDREIVKPGSKSLGEKFNPKTTRGTAYFGVPTDRKIHTVYQYTDEDGNLRYENVRYYPKDFRQRQFDTHGNAIYNLNGVPRFPYRLPQLIANANKADVFLTEGEKDCDALRELGFTASSFKNWQVEFNKYLADTHVIIVADHDKPGLAQANEAARIILSVPPAVAGGSTRHDLSVPPAVAGGSTRHDLSVPPAVAGGSTRHGDNDGSTAQLQPPATAGGTDRNSPATAGGTDRNLLATAKSVKILDVWLDREMPEKGGPDISDYIKLCVQDEGLDSDQIKERLSLMIENTAEWRDNSLNISRNLFVVKSGEEWLKTAKETTIPKMLFGEFWFENELCILFADTNVGKSILAVQIADRISRGGVSVPPAVAGGTDINATAGGTDLLRVEIQPQRVVYFDFELTVKQFESRFAERVEGSDHYQKHYKFHPNFLRAEINPETSDLHGFASFEEFLNHSLDATIVSSGAKVLIIDNLTYLRDETENARNALPLMKFLKELKSKHGLSILTLAHTPKRDSSKPLGRNDLQGSKMLINFCDSSFAIGESCKDAGLRYLKQIKSRNTEIIYNTENVLLANIQKVDNFLGFHFIGYGSEHEHLKPASEKELDAKVSKAKELFASGKNLTEIGQELGVSHTSVSRYLKK